MCRSLFPCVPTVGHPVLDLIFLSLGVMDKQGRVRIADANCLLPLLVFFFLISVTKQENLPSLNGVKAPFSPAIKQD